jgi:eukaryotic-like serine/threonine-protein kinase
MDTPHNLSGSVTSEQITRDYNILRLLGKGGMGEVYLAEQLRVGRRLVALKVLNRSCSEDPEVVRRFENEAASAGRISHPNVVTVYESRVTDDGQLCVAMEYVEGESLRAVLADEGAMEIEEAIEITKHICAGLAAAHKLGIVHRDIKPDNIMVNRHENGSLAVKVLDFGIARLLEAGAEGGQTKTGVVMGTPYYMSPEQALGVTGGKIDARSDIYSLGMVVYQMLTGKVAFESDSWMRVMYMHVNEQPLPPSRLRPELAAFGGIERVILKALEKDREDRQQTVSEFANELEAAYAFAKSPGAQPPVTEVYSPAAMADHMPFAATSSAAPQTYQQASADKEEQADKAIAGEHKFWTRSRMIAAVTVAAILIIAVALFALKRPAAGEAKPDTAVSTTPTQPAAMPAIGSFEFDVLGVNRSGQMSLLRRAHANYFPEDLGGVTMEMVEIPAGQFIMGSPESELDREQNEGPQHEVKLSSFYFGKFEVTQEQWGAAVKLPKVSRDLDPNPSAFKGEGHLPVQNVTWWEAVEFCERLSRFTGRKYRLPTEAEWEYACRAGTKTPFHFGDTVNVELVNYDAKYPYGAGPKGATRRQPIAVGNLGASNAFGLYDLHGNLAEWCLDPWHDNYIGAPVDGRVWEAGGSADSHAIRGGSWYDGGSNCRSAERVKTPSDMRLGLIGFRVVMVKE